MNQNAKNRQPLSAGRTPTAAGTTASVNLRRLLSRAGREAIGAQPIRMEIDAPECELSARIGNGLERLVASLVRGAVDVLDSDGEITITAWHRGAVLEVEVADNGPGVESRPQRLPMAAAAIGAELIWQNCPQGGVAVTAVLNASERMREAA